MNTIASWLVCSMIGLPMLGVFMALVLLARGRSREDSFTKKRSEPSTPDRPNGLRHESRWDSNSRVLAGVRLGMMAAFFAAILLLLLLSGTFGKPVEVPQSHMGLALSLPSPRPLRIEWAWRADLFAAGWVAALNGLSWLVLTLKRRDARDSSRIVLTLTAGMLNVTATMLVMSASLAQMLVCWGAVSLATWLMVGWASPEAESSLHSGEASDASRRPTISHAIVTGLFSDGLLVLAVLLMSVTCQTMVIDDIVSATGLAKLSENNPALPGFIGCLLVLSILGRSGLFPCFGWHRDAAAWSRPIWAMVYLVGYVPTAAWLLFRFHPLVASSNESLALLSGLSTLGAVLGAFVACGQRPQRSELAFLVTAQLGVVYAALAGGLFEAQSWRALWFGVTEFAPQASELGRVALGQLAVLAGAVFCWQRTRTACWQTTRTTIASPTHQAMAWSQPLAQLSRRRLYVDETLEFLVITPLQTWVKLARHGERLLTDSLFPALTVRLPGWFARQLEVLQVGHVEFDLATSLIGVAAILLTLLLVT